MLMTREEFEQKRRDLLVALSQKFHLKYTPVEDDIILIGKDYAVVFYLLMGETDVDYWLFNGKDIIEYPFRNFIFSTATEADRENIQWQKGFYGGAYADLQLLVNLFNHRWSRILLGDRSWLKQYHQSEDGYEPSVNNSPTAEYVVRIMQSTHK